MHLELLGLAISRMTMVPLDRAADRGTGKRASKGSSRSGAGIVAIEPALVYHAVQATRPVSPGLKLHGPSSTGATQRARHHRPKRHSI
jgi:hypothetical protein